LCRKNLAIFTKFTEGRNGYSCGFLQKPWNTLFSSVGQSPFCGLN